jgi:hypothetical protein
VHKIFLIIGILLPFYPLNAQQEKENSRVSTPFSFTGSIQVTTNGISTIPAYSLGKPAAMVMLNASKKRFTLNPMLALSLDGKPWYMAYWLRYNVIQKEKFTLKTSAAWGWAFRDADMLYGNDTMTIKRAFRSVFTEIRPTYLFSPHASVSVSYLYVRGLEEDFRSNIHCFTLNGLFIFEPVKNITCTIAPQLFNVEFIGVGSGTFASATVSFAHKKVPLSLGALVTQPVISTLKPESGFVWNVNLTYSFK